MYAFMQKQQLKSFREVSKLQSLILTINLKQISVK